MSNTVHTVKKQSRLSRSVQKIQEYNNNIRYQFRPNSKLASKYPLWLSPLLVGFIMAILLLIFMIIYVGFNPQFMGIPVKEKSFATLNVWAIVSGLTFLLSFILNFIVHGIAKKHKFQTSGGDFFSKVIFINVVVSLGLAFVLKFYMINASLLSIVFLPFLLFINFLLVAMMYRGFNEIYRRDKNGKIVMSEEYYARNQSKNKSTI